MVLNSKVPDAPVEKAWDEARFNMKLVNPANKRKYSVLVVGSGLGGSVGCRVAWASLAIR